MIKHLFSDLDGTLLNNNGKLSDYTKKIIGECNIPLTLVSARSPQKMESILNDLGVGGIHIAFNGAMVFKKENTKFTILNKEILDREFSRKLVLDIRSKFPKVGISLYDTDNWNVDLVNKVIEREKKVVKVNYNLVDFNQYFNKNLKEVYKVSFIEDDIEIFKKLVNYVEFNYSDEKITIQKSEINFIIGGSNGVGDELRRIVDFRLNFSLFTFPHQLMRLILAEQIYRWISINNNIKYHK